MQWYWTVWRGFVACWPLIQCIAPPPRSVLIVGKVRCPFTVEVRRLFDSLGTSYSYLNVDEETDGGAIHDVLKAEYKQDTVPYVFVGKVRGDRDRVGERTPL